MALRDFRLPDVGEGLTEAEILQWYVAVGDVVTINQMICEIETAKAAVELPSPYAGTVTALKVNQGETVDVGTVIITIEDGVAGESAPAAPAEDDRNLEVPTGKPKQAAVLVGYGVKEGQTPARRARKAASGTQEELGESIVVELHDGPVVAKPPVRKLAKDLGVDIRRIRKSGNITRSDVLDAAMALHGMEQPPATTYDPHREDRIPVKGVLKEMAQAMTTSAFTAPHVSVWLQVDVAKTLKAVKKLKDWEEFEGLRVSPLLIVAAAVLQAAKEFPKINSSWDEANHEVIIRRYINLGFAAATPRGLLVPVIHEADGMDIPTLAKELMALVDTAREGRTPPNRMQHGTITITNVGVLGIDGGTPILTPGQGAILAVGQIREIPWTVKGKMKVRPICQLTLSFDHRMIDGELGSRFLARIGALLEDPSELYDESDAGDDE
ncbi:MAG: 2-oxo acid dehydrogenase subunit E2 [Actinobacteria bacterium]|nr:2-oxo acid dehydrogenase subunit E2 [Actinomycetota bacterium]